MKTQSLFKIMDRYLIVISLVFSVAAVTVINSKLTVLRGGSTESSLPQYRKMDASLVKVLTFGHLPAVIDWVFIKALAESGDKPIGREGQSLLYFQLDWITDLDPLFYEMYVGGGNLLSVVLGDHKGATNLVLKGTAFIKKDLSTYPGDFKNKYWTTPWSVYILLAYLYLFQLDDLPKASEAFREAATYADAPLYLSSLDRRLAAPGGKYDVGLKLLDFQLRGSYGPKDEKVKQKLTARKENLLISYYLYNLNVAFEKFAAGHLDHVSWTKFLAQTGQSSLDPWGGALSIDPTGRIATTTPYEAVFGIR